MKRARLVLAVALACASLCSCSAESASPRSEPAPQRAESPARLWLREAQRVDALADRTQSAQEQRDAAAALATLAGTPSPEGLPGEDALTVRQDLYGRAADLYAKLGEPRRALALLTEGLELGDSPNPFHTQLMIQTAEVKAAMGDAQGAEEAKELARQLVR